MEHSIKAIKDALAHSGSEVPTYLIQEARAELQAIAVKLGDDEDYAYTISIQVYDRVDGTDRYMYTLFAEDADEIDDIITTYTLYGRQAPTDPYIRITFLGE